MTENDVESDVESDLLGLKVKSWRQKKNRTENGHPYKAAEQGVSKYV